MPAQVYVENLYLRVRLRSVVTFHLLFLLLVVVVVGLREICLCEWAVGGRW